VVQNGESAVASAEILYARSAALRPRKPKPGFWEQLRAGLRRKEGFSFRA
jgi:hypothetical protein